MKPYKLTILILLIFKSVLLFGQQMRVISGTLKDQVNGEPLPGVNIVVEGTTNGVITNIDGKYKIFAPLGAKLVFSFVGYNAEKVLVTEENSKPLGNEPLPAETPTKPPLKKKAEVKFKSSYTPVQVNPLTEQDTTGNKAATAVFTAFAPTYRLNRLERFNYWYDIQPARISDIQFGDKEVKIKQRDDAYFRIPHITFLSSFSLDRSIRLPELQNEYAQGRPFNGYSLWRGPETGELFSFGPAMGNLEYDGSDYLFDNNGRLVTKGTGNGKGAQAYNPARFFRTGFTLTNALRLSKREEKVEYSASYNNKRINGVIPTACKNANTFEFLYNRKISWNFRIKNNFSYEGYKSRLMSSSPVTSFLLASVFTTPPTFDNTNGITSHDASKNASAYKLGGVQRSYSNLANNPYWLINNIIDKENYSALNEALELKLEIVRSLNLSVNGGISSQQFHNAAGYCAGTNGLNTIQYIARNHQLFSVSTLSKLDYYDYLGFNYDCNLYSQLSYSFKYTRSSKERNLMNGSNEMLSAVNSEPYLRVHNLGWVTGISYDNKIMAKFSQNLIYNEYPSAKQELYSPSLSAGINLHNFIDYYKLNFLSLFKIRANWGYIFSEMPLSFNYGSYAYQPFGVEQFQQSLFSYELAPDFTLNPEKILKKGIGADLGFFRNQFTLTAEYYENTTYHGIFAIQEMGNPALRNCADYRNKGVELDLAYNHWRRNNFAMYYKLVFTRNSNKVTRLYSNQDIIPLAGLNNIQTALIEGLPGGVIVGSSYMRNNEGQMIIGNDGYPLVDPDLCVLADPNPDFTLGFEANLSYKRLSFSFLLELSKGGEIWNGTENVLSYYGVSQSSAEQRKVTEYIYSGVKEDGMPNNIPVDFANTAKPFSANRWQQYGVGGVAEDAIQDATFFRVKEVTVGYSVNKRHDLQIEINAFVTNPLFIASSKGVDPASVLWSNANAKGLQLFNIPSVSSVGLGIRLKI